MSPPLHLADLRRYAIARSLFATGDLAAAIERLGFVQADPIRAPARAQDLVLRHRVVDYRVGDLDRAYPALDVEEDVLVNYGFVARRHYESMHPRRVRPAWAPARRRRALAMLDFIGERGEAHPRDIEARFAHGAVINAWGGSSNATTHLLDAMHYRGLLRVARRDAGIRIYAVRAPLPEASLSPASRLDALADAVVATYAPLTGSGLSFVIRRLRYGAPQLASGIDAAIARAKQRLAHMRIDGAEWYWPPHESPRLIAETLPADVRLLAPFDPIVWDRSRFERFFGWPYRFEAYTPAAKRKLGYYALPLLHDDAIVGWANVSMTEGAFAAERGYVSGAAPRSRAFRSALDDELSRMRTFLTPRS